MDIKEQARAGSPPPQLLTAPEVAAILAKPIGWVYAAALAGIMPSVKVGQAVRFEPGELAGWLAGNRRGTPEAVARHPGSRF